MARHIYVHIPFCARKCSYCDFYSIAAPDKINFFFDALRKEILSTRIIEDVNPDSTDTVYFGGGTPSVPEARFICEILSLIKERFSIKPDAEITIECNPASVTKEKFEAYKTAGFNRVSIGIQSLHDNTLNTLGRLHDKSRAIETIKEAKEAGFTNISCDLMIGIPGQTKEEILDDAKTLVDMGVSHVSMYSLIIEEGTPFYDRYKNIEDFVDPDLERDMYHSLRDYFKSRGLEPYEISNCGKTSIHNMSYWKGMEYYAFGPAASGYLNGIRFSHDRNVDEYIADPMKVTEDEILSFDEKAREYIMLMLRTSGGPDKKEFHDRFGKDIFEEYKEETDKLSSQGLITSDDDGFRLTKKGLDFANLAFEEFI
ncbi:MAG: radical SAM family heme chaperone HemW [Clostridia bacterium]|nr:radical SAM family heme chaperone HemW [Clostridia bacterium]